MKVYFYTPSLISYIDLISIGGSEKEGDEKDLMQNFVSLVTSFCARIYGKRRTKRATEKN